MKYVFSFRCLLVLLLIGVTGAPAHGGPAEAWDTVKRTFKVRPGGTLFIDLDHGNVTVEVGRDDLVHIEVERIVEADSEEEAKRILDRHELDFLQDGNNVHFRSRFEDQRWTRKLWGRSTRFKMEVRVKVPERFNVDFSNGAGNLVIADVVGRVAGRTGAGNVRIGTVRGPVEVSSGAGNIEVDGAVGRVEVSSGAGNITLRRIEGQILAHTGAGNITAQITSQPEDASRLESGAGNVTVYLDRDVGVYVDAVAGLGSAECEYGLEIEGKWMKKSFGGRVNGGGPELTLRSGVGNVALKKM
ncbi:DUF4097 domain-containing protein [Rhodocaloribacter litoris]|uniref:DUF4097 family beta strand repeat-containing protein n=1 Tax=Rhodocaloribacter litoris TaxID=2558931 RepID=UPI00141ED258|nr:DUF4097 domain-containing protein [Rhodocaloribacter litoris]QXD14581.1 DUF4097 domain-containing protein [Rhodocaloribacter litoris]GIV59649.1 MAG: hypothetical protein KatS3mg043_0738 [Rhodothermaceae bacterium]